MESNQSELGQTKSEKLELAYTVGELENLLTEEEKRLLTSSSPHLRPELMLFMVLSRKYLEKYGELRAVPDEPAWEFLLEQAKAFYLYPMSLGLQMSDFELFQTIPQWTQLLRSGLGQTFRQMDSETATEYKKPGYFL